MEIFKLYFPQPVDIPLNEYQADKENIDKIAAQHGYSYVGATNKQAVFSTKQ